MNIRRATLFLCGTLLCMDSCLSQKDCTGVDCPAQQNCIDTTLEEGACCPTCTQRGCTCEGYQYYDCIQAGFQKGKVPEGESYFVDFGSTECSCPQGGGKISCHFIPCPELPPNCIDILQPADGCLQCGRIGCTHGNIKYEAGHSFQMDQCQVCHCPNEGGRLMCSPVPTCDRHVASKPIWVTTTENNSPLRHVNSHLESSQMSPMEPFSKLAPGNSLPLYKQDPPSFGTEHYDDTLPGPTSSTIPDLAQPLESTTVLPISPESNSTPFSSHDEQRHELRETEENRNAVVTHVITPTTVETLSETSTVLRTTQKVTTENHMPQQEIVDRPNSESKTVLHDTFKDTAHTAHVNHQKPSQDSHPRSHGSDQSVDRKEKVSVEHQEEQGSIPKIQFSPTNKPPVRMREDGRQPQSHNHQPQGAEGVQEGMLA